MPASVQITALICATIVLLGGLFVLFAWIGTKKK